MYAPSHSGFINVSVCAYVYICVDDEESGPSLASERACKDGLHRNCAGKKETVMA